MAAIGRDIAAVSAKEISGASFKIVALVQLTPGSVYDDLRDWDEGAIHQWEHAFRSKDAKTKTLIANSEQNAYIV